MKRHNLLNLLTALISLISVNAYAHDIAVQNDDKIIYYNFINNNSELEVTFSGTSYSYEDNEYSGNIVIPESVIYQGTAYSVTSIGEHALSFCSRLTSVSIPNSVTSIGNGAFQNCINIKTVSIPNSVISIGDKAFEACISLTTVSISNSATSIGAYAFNGCNKLKTVNIPSGVRDINERTFYGCSSLASIELPNTITSIEAYAFGGCSSLASIELPNTITSIGKAAFSSCSSLTEITIPGSLLMETEDYFSQFAFSGCSGLRKITINKGAAVWGNALFDSSQRVVETVVVYNETPIDVYDSFFWIANHATLYVPSGCSAAYKEASGWKKFTKIVEMDPDVDYSDIGKTFTVDGINYKVSSINPLEVQVGWYQESSLGGAIGANYEGPLTIPSSVTGPNGKVYACTSICDEAFLNHSGLTSITIPNGVTTIAQGVFHGCTSLASITIPNSITSIGAEAFRNCSGLISITIPNSVTSIGDYAFYDCGDLTSVLVESQTPLNIYEGVFSNRANATLYVPKDSKAAYEGADYWKEFKEIIEMENSPVAEYTDEQGVKFSLNDDESTYSVSGHTDACTGDIIIPSSVNGCSVTSIGNSAFMNCYALSTITIPNSVTSIGQNAFSDCTSLALVNMEVETPIAITADVFTNADRVNAALHVPAGCKVAYADAPIWNEFGTILEGNEGTIINANTTEGWNVAFTTLDDTKKTCQVGYLDGSFNKPAVDRDAVDGSLTIPESVDGYKVVKIGKYAFDNTIKMTSVTIPATVTYIDRNAFFNCNGLTSFELPAGVAHLGDRALSSLRGVTSLKVADGNTFYDSHGDCNAIIETATNKLLFGSKITTIPADVPEIGESAFENMDNFTFTIPSTVTKIDDNAFYFCSNWTLQVENATPLQISENVFGDMSNSTTLRVPNGSKSAYAAATGWKNFGTIEEGNEGSTFTAKTTEGIDMVFTILDESAKTCQVGYLDGSQDKVAVDKGAVEGPVTIPETINGYTVVKIGKSAFCSVYGMTSVTIPNTVTSIDEYAFNCCWGLTTFELPASVTHLGSNALSSLNVTSLSVAEGNTKYDSRDNCNAIIEKATNKLLFGCINTTIPESVTGIASYSFLVANLNLYIPSTVTTIEGVAFTGNNLIIQVGHTDPLEISEAAFQNYETLILRVPLGSKTKYTTATGWKNFGKILEGNEGTTFTAKTIEGWDMVFTILDETAKTCQVGYLDGALDKISVNRDVVNGVVTIPQTVEGYTVVKIGKSAFNSIYTITSITIPNTVTAIDDYAFAACTGLTSFELPASVTSIGINAFGPNNITSIKVAENNAIYDSRDNCNAIIETITNKLLIACTKTTIPASVTEIGSGAFDIIYNCTFTIPSTITKIDDYAFSSHNLNLQVEHTTPLVISENVFQNLENSTLRVPAGCKTAYMAATGWNKFDIILEGNEGATFTTKTTEGWDMVFSILDDNEKTCQVGYIDGAGNKLAVDKSVVNDAVTIPQTVEGYTVVKIGKFAFYDIDAIKSVSIPETVTSIDDYAFFSCDGLSSFELSASVTNIGKCAFAVPSLKVAEGNPKYDSRDNCNAIIEKATNILVVGCRTTRIPASVSEIGSYAFTGLYDCTILLPSTITKIGDHAFEGNRLTLQVENMNPLVINENVFQGLNNSTLRVPAGCKAVYAEATGWSKFNNILEGNEGSSFTVKTTEGYEMVFTVLDETAKTCQVGYLDGSWDKVAVDKETVEGPVTIPEKANNYTVVKIGKWALTNINGMTSVTIPNTVTYIDEFAFRYCNGLTSFDLPASVTYVGQYALSALSNVTSIKVAEGNPNYDSRDNCNAIIETATNKLLFGYKISTIPASVKEIGENAFYNLNNCTLTIPSTITKICDYAFGFSYYLTLQVENTVPLVISENVFSDLRYSTLRVPTGSKSAYAEATGWSKFETIMEGNEGTTFTAQTTEGWDMVFSILDDDAKTCQVGYLDGSSMKIAVDKEAVNGAVTIPQTVEGYTVVKIGEYAFQGVNGMTSVTIPETVTAIGDFAFAECNGLTSFELPASVSAIGIWALSGLENAKSITVAEGNTTYDSRDNCNAIIEKATNKLLFGYKTTIIPASVTEIGSIAFDGFSDFTLTIPSTITAIDDGAFSCNYLTLQVEHTTPLVIEDAFRNLHNSTLRVPAGCKAAYVAATGWNNFDYIFEGNEGATFTAKTTEGWDMVFTVLNETAKTCQVGYIYGSYDKIAIDRNVVNGAVTIPQTIEGYTVVKIGKFAFFNNDGITSVTIPNSVTSIDEYAFSSCYLLTSLEIPASVTNIGDRAFSDLNYYKTSIKVAEGNPNYDSRDNCNAIIETATNKLLFGCKNTKIPASVTEIGDRAFSGILLGNSTILIPSTITKIDDYAFAWCNDLVMEVERTTPLQINENVFEGLSNSTLLVPTGSKEAYAAATGWSKFDNIIFDYKVSKNVETAGTLSQMISDAEKFTIRELTITGSLNGEDFRFIREMAGSDYNGVPTDGILTTLDLSGATIVAGGSYVEIQDKKVYLNKEKTIYTSSGGVVDGEKVSEANKIGAYLFAGCQKLQTITLPNNITAIDDFGFWATGLTAITMPNTVTSIGSDAFFTCNYLASVAIPSSVTSISSAFHGCSDLASITVDSNNPVYDSRNGCNAIIETSSNTLLVGCENTTIPNGIIIIGSAALSYKNLTSITIPGSVTTIGNNAFGGNNLTSITIPSSVTSIANYAFADNKLQTVTIENPTPVAIYDDTFSNRSNIDLIVPEGRSAIYKSANYWKDFKSIKDTKGNSEDPITEATINVTTAGTLSQFISDAEKFTITDLTITGPLNGTDFRLLREMAGCDYLGRPTEGKLQKLDLSGATIVAGGDKYFDRDGLYHENGERQYGFGQHSVTTRDNVIGECLFAGCSKLEEIKIPANIIEIGEFAFMCTNISSFDIPETIEKVALSFFWGTKISTLHIPQNVTTLTASYFMGNQATLSSITVDANNAKFDSRNNCNAIVEKESNTLLLGCKNTTIPDGITSIGLCAFVRCYNLTSITIPASVTSLQEGAFFDTGLNSISLPSTLKRIEFNALAYNNIASITIPASVEFIGQSALRACRDLTQITVEAENTIYDSRNNCNAIIETATNTLIQGCNTATIPATVTAIGNQAFQECHDLANITIPSSVTSIADCAFYECENLTSVSVGVNTPLAISENTFSNRANATLYVPTGCVDAYKEAEYWKEFKEIIGTEVQTDNIVFSGSNLWAGYVASEDLAIPAGLEAYVITSLGTTTATASSLNYIPQGVPVLLKRDNASINNYEVSTGSGTAPTVNLLRAYEYDKSVSNREGFILYNDEFVLVNEGTLPAGRVFLPANGSGRGLTRSIVFDRDDIIDSDDSQNNDGSNQWYDIQGRKLEQKPTKKGIYILDGRKVVIK